MSDMKGASAGWWVRVWRAGIEHESHNSKLPNKKVVRCAFPRLRAYVAQTSAACQLPEGKKVANLLCVGTVCCMGHKLLEQTLHLPSAACPLIFIHKSKQDAVPSSSTEYYGTEHIRMIIWIFWPCRTVDRPKMARYFCMCLPLPH